MEWKRKKKKQMMKKCSQTCVQMKSRMGWSVHRFFFIFSMDKIKNVTYLWIFPLKWINREREKKRTLFYSHVIYIFSDIWFFFSIFFFSLSLNGFCFAICSNIVRVGSGEKKSLNMQHKKHQIISMSFCPNLIIDIFLLIYC